MLLSKERSAPRGVLARRLQAREIVTRSETPTTEAQGVRSPRQQAVVGQSALVATLSSFDNF